MTFDSLPLFALTVYLNVPLHIGILRLYKSVDNNAIHFHNLMNKTAECGTLHCNSLKLLFRFFISEKKQVKLRHLCKTVRFCFY